MTTILPLLLPDYKSDHTISGHYLYYNKGGSTYRLPNDDYYSDRIACGSLILMCKEWAYKVGYQLFTGIDDDTNYRCYYDPIPNHARDYYIDQWDYTTSPLYELTAVLKACTLIHNTRTTHA